MQQPPDSATAGVCPCYLLSWLIIDYWFSI